MWFDLLVAIVDAGHIALVNACAQAFVGEVEYGEIIFSRHNLATIEEGCPLMQELMPVHIGTRRRILVGDKTDDHRAFLVVLDKVAHRAAHRNQLDV